MDQIEEVRSKVDIVQLISEYTPLLKAGRNFKAVCPFHSEKTASFIVSPERQIFKCFGCQAGGDVFGFLMKMEGMEFGECLRTLAKRTGVKLVSYHPTTRESEKEKLYEINHLASEFYHFLLLSHPLGKKALDYLSGRGISQESIKLFKIGYAPPLWDGLQRFLVGKKGYKIEDVARVGLVTRQPSSAWRDFFRDRLIFSLRDHRGNTIGFTGRVLGTWKNDLGPKYINNPESDLYHKGEILYGLDLSKQAIKTQNQAIVVEGQMDLISSYQADVQNLVAVSGSALTEYQCRILKRFCETLVLAFDVDLAGDQAARRGIKTAENFGFTIKVAQIPQGKDPDDLIRQNPGLWKKVIGSAVGVYDFLLDSAFSRWNIKEAEGKKRIGQEIIPILSGITDEIVKNHYIRLLAARLEVDMDAVLRQIGKVENTPGKKESAIPISEVIPRRQMLEEYLLSLLFQGEKAERILEKEIKKEITTPALQKILDFLEKYLSEGKFDSRKFAQTLPPELLEIFNTFYLLELGGDSWEQEIKKVSLMLAEMDLREKIKKTSLEIARLEKEGKEDEIEEVKKRFSSLCRKLGKVS